MEQAAVIDAVAPLELSSDPVRLTDPTGRVVQVADRPPDTAPTMVVLSYEAPGGTAPSALGGGTSSSSQDSSYPPPPPRGASLTALGG